MIELINQIKAVYPSKDIDSCIERDTNEVFWIDEDDKIGKSFILRTLSNDEDEESVLKIINTYKKELNLLCIDACIFSSSDGSRCDCAVFDDTKFCFCELKFNVTKQKNATENLSSARNQQLDNTITILKSQLNFSLFQKLEAYVAMRKTLYPRTPARLLGIKTAFWDKHQVEYFEEKEIIFDTPLKKNL